MTGLITLTSAGIMTGPFNIYSNVDGFISAFATNISRDQLLAGYTATNIPETTTVVRVSSYGACYNHIDLIMPEGTTTTSTSSTSTTSTTTSSSSTTTTTTTVCPYRYLAEITISGVLSDGVITLTYTRKDGTVGTDSWTVGGSGEELFYTFGVGTCIVENSVGIDGGNIIEKVWIDGSCCP